MITAVIIRPEPKCLIYHDLHFVILTEYLIGAGLKQFFYQRLSRGPVFTGNDPLDHPACLANVPNVKLRCVFSATRTSSQVTFPVDFFEHNQQLTEVEFGGNDLLQVYNGQQIKHRLNSTGMYVANTKVGTIRPNDSSVFRKKMG